MIPSVIAKWRNIFDEGFEYFVINFINIIKSLPIKLTVKITFALANAHG